MEPRTFLLDELGGIATVTLNRPERLNALTLEAYAELRDWFRRLRRRKDVRAVILRGAGRGFCSGGDVYDVIGPLVKGGPGALRDFNRMTCDLILHMRRAPQPVVAAVNGVAAGGGAALALGCDVRIASPEAKFIFLFPRVGLSGADMGAAYLLPRVVGLGRAMEWLLLGEPVGAEQALAGGLVTRVVPSGALAAETRAVALRLAHGPEIGTPVTKEMIYRELPMSLEQALRAEAAAQTRCMGHRDFREAYEAFVQKREPNFAGR